MPGRDGTGPMGMGAMTGRGLGPCGGGMANGQGFGMGFGRGMGRGFGRGAFCRRGFVPAAQGYAPAQPTKAALEDQARYLESLLKDVKESIERMVSKK